ncbi:hypothetical protein M1523_01310 [Patescibacteria group bacterium]|nr:hypothetical protein [Patescibacteria group bacterium]MCL5091970.1 hypothetical protein [Patescibacteria group bacterium]
MINKKIIVALIIILIVLVVLPSVLVMKRSKINQNNSQITSSPKVATPTPLNTYSKDLFLKLRQVGENEKEATGTKTETITVQQGETMNLQVPEGMSSVSAETWKKYIK